MVASTNQRQTALVGNGGDGRQVEHLEQGVAQGFGKHHFGALVDGVGEGPGRARIDEGGVDSETRHGVGQKVVSAAVEGARGDDVNRRR